MPRSIRSDRLWRILGAALCLAAPFARGGWVESTPDGTIIHVKCWALPDPTRTDTASRADAAALNAFVERFPAIFAETYRDRYRANPEIYGDFDWDNVQINLHTFSGISIEGQGMDSQVLMAIAGGVAPDILYVNFRQSDTYIQQGFLYPLDKPEDGYLSAMSEEEIDFRVHPRIWPVIRRRGPQGNEHVWAMPYGGVLGKVVLYRRDLLAAAGVPEPTNDWTWDDFFEACRKITNPEQGTYGIVFGTGPTESFLWVTFLWSAGGEVMEYDPETDEWRAVFDSREAAVALDYYIRLCTERWVDESGRRRRGYASKDPDQRRKWDLGQIGFTFSYIDEKMFSTINPDVTGMVPVPIGPTGIRGAELNSRMMGIFAGVDNPVVRDAAWEYLKFHDSPEAVGIRTGVLVEGGLGRFVNPKYLRMFGYEDIVRLAPRGWEECFDIAIETGQPEPYGRNCQLVYNVMSKPIQEVEQMARDGRFEGMDREERLDIMQAVLRRGVEEANQKMIGILTPRQKVVRRASAVAALIAIVLAFRLVFRRIARAFTPPKLEGVERHVKWGFRKYFWAYVILLPAVLSILVWQYLPLLMGSVMAFQDYQIMLDSAWVGVDNFGNVLWDPDWWHAVWNSVRYSLLVIGLTFLPPVILAVFLQEIPYGTLFFRTVFYLPAVITGLVVIYLWKSFYAPTEFGVLNSILLRIPALGYLGLGGLLFLILYLFAQRLYVHQKYWVSALCLAAGLALFSLAFSFALPIFRKSIEAVRLSQAAGAGGAVTAARDVLQGVLRGLLRTDDEPYRWLLDSNTAMLACVLPMVWAGMGPGCLIYLAALKGIAPDFYEAADIDGATFLDKILFVVIPILKPLLIIQFVGVFIGAWRSSAFILAMTGGGSRTEVAGLHIFYKAYMHLQFGPATAMAWVLGFMLIGFTVHQLRILSRLEFKTTGNQ